MTTEFFGDMPAFLRCTVGADGLEQLRARGFGELAQVELGGPGVAFHVGDGFAGGDHAQAQVVCGQLAHQRLQRGVFESSGVRTRRVLHGLDAVEDQKCALLPHKLSQAQAALEEQLARDREPGDGDAGGWTESSGGVSPPIVRAGARRPGYFLSGGGIRMSRICSQMATRLHLA